MEKKHGLGAFCVVLAAILWGMIGIFVRGIKAYGFGEMQIVALRSLGAVVVLLLYCGIFHRSHLLIKLRDIWVFLGTGIGSMVFFNFCYFGSINRTSLAVAAALLYTAPAFVAVLARIFLKEKLTTINYITIVVAIIGSGLTAGIFSNGVEIDALGLLFGLGSGLGYAMYSIFGKIAIKKGYSDVTITLYTFLMAAMVTAGTLLDDTLATLQDTGDFLWPVAGLVLLSTVLAYIFFTKGLSYVPAAKASVIASIEPVVATIIGIFIYKEHLKWDVCIGIILILASAVISGWKSKGAE